VTSTLGQLYCFSELGSEFATIHHPKEVLERDRPFASKKSKSDTTEQPAAPVVDQDDVGDMEPDTIDNDTGDDFDFGAEEPDATTTDDQPAEDDGTDFGGEDDDNPFDFGDEF
ncbi:MAG: hypothetical protein KDB27_09250, partial [Planctomycetales bacterium]|nr:hypothetical protein [Planctomycetales bacterium]